MADTQIRRSCERATGRVYHCRSAGIEIDGSPRIGGGFQIAETGQEMAILGVIGGSGFYDLEGLHDVETIEIDTPFGQPSAPLRRGTLGATELVFIARHGIGHGFSPTEVPYRANIHAFKQFGVEQILSLSAVGSLRETLPPRSLVLPDQIIDRTLVRARTYFEDGIVAHVGIADPFCAQLQDAISAAALGVGHLVHRGGAYV